MTPVNFNKSQVEQFLHCLGKQEPIELPEAGRTADKWIDLIDDGEPDDGDDDDDDDDDEDDDEDDDDRYLSALHKQLQSETEKLRQATEEVPSTAVR